MRSLKKIVEEAYKEGFILGHAGFSEIEGYEMGDEEIYFTRNSNKNVDSNNPFRKVTKEELEKAYHPIEEKFFKYLLYENLILTPKKINLSFLKSKSLDTIQEAVHGPEMYDFLLHLEKKIAEYEILNSKKPYKKLAKIFDKHGWRSKEKIIMIGKSIKNL